MCVSWSWIAVHQWTVMQEKCPEKKQKKRFSECEVPDLVGPLLAEQFELSYIGPWIFNSNLNLITQLCVPCLYWLAWSSRATVITKIKIGDQEKTAGHIVSLRNMASIGLTAIWSCICRSCILSVSHDSLYRCWVIESCSRLAFVL